MSDQTLRLFAAATSLAVAALAQSPSLRMDAAVQLSSTGATVTYDVTAAPGAVFAALADTSGGPVTLLGERFYLGMVQGIVTLQAGVIPASGTVPGTIPIPPIAGVIGMAIFAQGAVIDTGAPNGLFRTTNGESAVPFAAPGAVVADFADPVASGYTGTFQTNVAGHIAGGAVTRRTHETIDPQGIPFPAPLQNPLNPLGCREQMVFRTQDLGATGDPELITAIRWQPLNAIVADTFSQFEIAVGHTTVTPDYTVDPFTALPVAPNSGLDPVFASNGNPQSLFSGQYDLLPAMQQANGYYPFPVLTPFAYDGVSSLLIETRCWADPLAAGTNGIIGRLMVASSALPAARNTAGGGTGMVVNPATVPVGVGDNWMAELEIEFARVQTQAMSPLLDSGSTAPDYGVPVMAASLPPGTSVQVEYRGVPAPGAAPTAWSPTPDIADGLRFLQFRLTFRASLQSGEVPIVDTLVVPVH